MWEGKEHTPEYASWKGKHQCKKNSECSSGRMEPHGLSVLFKGLSLTEKIRYKYLISDGDSKAHSLILEQQPYGSSCIVEKIALAMCTNVRAVHSMN